LELLCLILSPREALERADIFYIILKENRNETISCYTGLKDIASFAQLELSIGSG
jgi:hypothetical protein